MLETIKSVILSPVFAGMFLLLLFVLDLFVLRTGFITWSALILTFVAIKFFTVLWLINEKTNNSYIKALGISILYILCDFFVYLNFVWGSGPFRLAHLLKSKFYLSNDLVLAGVVILLASVINTLIEGGILCLFFPAIRRLRIFQYLFIANILFNTIFLLLPMLVRFTRA